MHELHGAGFRLKLLLPTLLGKKKSERPDSVNVSFGMSYNGTTPKERMFPNREVSTTPVMYVSIAFGVNTKASFG